MGQTVTLEKLPELQEAVEECLLELDEKWLQDARALK